MGSQVFLYNPRFNSPEILEQMLVGRDDLLEEIMDDFKRQAHSESRQHWLVRGHRGFGKTHVAGILYHRVRSDPFLSRYYIPIWLSETAPYEAYSAGTFLRVIGRQLVEELQEKGDPGAGPLQEGLKGIETPGDDPALFEVLSELLKAESGRLKKIFLVFMENLDALLDSFPKARGDAEAMRLRALLTQEKEFLFLSTTPTRYLPKLSHPKAPLYGHLKERYLRALTEEETGRLILNLAKVSGRPFLSAPSGDGRDVKLRNLVLHRLTGGSPRAIVMAFMVMSGPSGLEVMVQEFRSVLDQNTPYFEARLHRLAPRERVILTAMALAPVNLTIKEIAQRTGLPERSLSTLVNRLVQEGHLAPTEGGGGKGTHYEVTDGLFRLWYQYRQGRRILPDLVRFLALWYPAEELELTVKSMKPVIRDSMPMLARETREIILLQVEDALRYARSPLGMMAREGLWKECEREAMEPSGAQLPRKLKKIVERALKEMEPKLLMEAASELEAFLHTTGKKKVTYAEQAISAFLDLGKGFRQLNQPQGTESTYRKAISLFAEVSTPSAQMGLLRVTMDLAATLDKTGNIDEAISTCRDLIGRLGKIQHTGVQKVTAGVMVNLGAMLGQKGNIDEAIDNYRNLIDRYGKIDNMGLQETVAMAMVNLGASLGQKGNIDEAIETYRHAIRQFQRKEHTGIRVQVANAMVNLAITLRLKGDIDEATEISRSAIAQFGKVKSMACQEAVALAKVNLSVLLGLKGNTDEAIKISRDVIAQFGKAESERAQGAAAAAMLSLSVALGKKGAFDEAIETLRQMLRTGQSHTAPLIQEQVAGSMIVLALTLINARRNKEAVDTLVDLVDVLEKGYRVDYRILSVGLRLILVIFRAPDARSYLDRIGALQDKAYHEQVRFFGFVLDLIEADEPGPGKDTASGPGARKRKALARIPPELRKTVEEAASQLLSMKKELARQDN